MSSNLFALSVEGQIYFKYPVFFCGNSSWKPFPTSPNKNVYPVRRRFFQIIGKGYWIWSNRPVGHVSTNTLANTWMTLNRLPTRQLTQAESQLQSCSGDRVQITRNKMAAEIKLFIFIWLLKSRSTNILRTYCWHTTSASYILWDYTAADAQDNCQLTVGQSIHQIWFITWSAGQISAFWGRKRRNTSLFHVLIFACTKKFVQSKNGWVKICLLDVLMPVKVEWRKTLGFNVQRQLFNFVYYFFFQFWLPPTTAATTSSEWCIRRDQSSGNFCMPLFPFTCIV